MPASCSRCGSGSAPCSDTKHRAVDVAAPGEPLEPLALGLVAEHARTPAARRARPPRRAPRAAPARSTGRRRTARRTRPPRTRSSRCAGSSANGPPGWSRRTARPRPAARPPGPARRPWRSRRAPGPRWPGTPRPAPRPTPGSAPRWLAHRAARAPAVVARAPSSPPLGITRTLDHCHGRSRTCRRPDRAVRCCGGPLPRHRRGAAGAEARRGGPDRHAAHPPARQGARGGQGRAPHPVPLGGPAGAVQPRRRAVLHRAFAGHRHPGADRRRVRRRDHRRLPPLHGGLRGAGDGRPAGRRGGRAGAAGVPAAGRRDPGAVRSGAGPVAGAGRVPAARDDATPAGPRRSTTAPAAPSPARTRRSTSPPGERSARAAARPAR